MEVYSPSSIEQAFQEAAQHPGSYSPSGMGCNAINQQQNLTPCLQKKSKMHAKDMTSLS